MKKYIIFSLMIFLMLIPSYCISESSLEICYNFIEKEGGSYEAIQAAFEGEFLSGKNMLKISYKDSFFERDKMRYDRESLFKFKKYITNSFNWQIYFRNKGISDYYNMNIHNVGLGMGYDWPIFSICSGISFKKRHFFCKGTQYIDILERQDVIFSPDIELPYISGERIIDYIFKYGDLIIIDKWIPGFEFYDRTYWFDVNAEFIYKSFILFGEFSFNIDDIDDYTYKWGIEMEMSLGNDFYITPGFEIVKNEFCKEKIGYSKIGYRF